MPEFTLTLWVAMLAIALGAGFVKGAVGFAMPMIMVSGLGSLLPPEVAIGALILPTLFTNIFQALRDGWAAAVATTRQYWRFLVVMLTMIAFSAQLVTVLPDWLLYLSLGVPVVFFAALQLAGFRPTIPPHKRRQAEFSVGGVAGFIGGLSGVWGPPTVLYLTALNTPKVEQLRTQGIAYGLGAIMLTVGHLYSGVFNAAIAPLSAALLVPAMLGTIVGMKIADRLDQRRFRQVTLVVLVVAGLNLVRRGLMG